MNSRNSEWEKSNIQVFWGEIAPCEHVVQIYDNDKIFMDTLEGFVGSGLLAGDCVVLIASQEHIANLEKRIINQGFDLPFLKADDRLILVEVNEGLSRFMVNDWPDEDLFTSYITSIIQRAHSRNRKVRAFGEMVAVLWEKGLNGATVQLENLWNQLHQKDGFSLFCAYPRIGFDQCASDSVQTICSAHAKVIEGGAKPSTEIYYKTR